MILPNMIYNHGLSLPDICDFPDAGEPLFPSELNEEINAYDSHFGAAFSNLVPHAFNVAYDDLIKSIRRYIKLDNEEEGILNEQVTRVKNAVSLYMDSCINQVDRDDIPATEMSEAMDNDGCYGFFVNTNQLKQIRSYLNSDIEQLLSIGDHDAKPHFYDRFYAWKRNEKPVLFDMVDEIFNFHGVFNACSKYNRNRRNLSLDTIALHIATPTDTHHFQTLRDLPTTSKCISLHMDPKFNLVKSLLYLNDVDKDTGPFTTVPTSNRWYYEPFERLVACGNSTGNYLDTPKKRKVLRMFPSKMRKNVILGRYILDDTVESDMLLTKMKEWTSDIADCIIFDPTQTLHRGGLCTNKNRINLQILMR